jgi:hypothetical protein
MTAGVEAPRHSSVSPYVFFARSFAFRFRRHIAPAKVASAKNGERIGQDVFGFAKCDGGTLKRAPFAQEYNRISWERRSPGEDQSWPLVQENRRVFYLGFQGSIKRSFFVDSRILSHESAIALILAIPHFFAIFQNSNLHQSFADISIFLIKRRFSSGFAAKTREHFKMLRFCASYLTVLTRWTPVAIKPV